MTTSFRLTLTLALACSAATAQNLLSYRTNSITNARMRERPCDSRAWNPTCMAGSPFGDYNGPSRPFAGHPKGGIAVDARDAVVFTTNGNNTIQRREYPRIGSYTGALLPDLAIPAAIGPVHGMAFNPLTRHLFLTNGTAIYEVDPDAGMAILTVTPASPLNILAGLDFDPATPNRIYGVSTAGEIGTYTIGLGLVSYAPPSYPVPAGAIATGAIGLAKDKSGGGDFYVAWGNGDVFNHSTGLAHSVVHARTVGITYIPSAVRLESSSPAAAAASVMTSHLVTDGRASFGLQVVSLPVGTPLVIWAIDVLSPGAAPTCLSPLSLPGAGDLWPPSLLLVDASPVVGTASGLAMPLPAGFVGWTLIAQPAIFDAASPVGVNLLNGMQLEISNG